MRRAVELARLGVGSTSPNPSVGAVILDPAGHLVGEGRTAPPPGPHAEIVALGQAGERARGATLVVTLEPCAHFGRTPPCVAAILAAGVARVCYAVADPDPRAAGGGVALRAAGVGVQSGLLAEQAERAMQEWLLAARAGRPHVTLKLAASLDGRAAAADGASRWITGEQARADGHLLRAGADAVLVGVGTVLADDPALTARTPAGAPLERQPLRVVLDSAGRTPARARVRDGSAATLVLTGADVPAGPGGLDPASVLQVLHGRGVRSVLVEGGPRVAGSFLEAGLVDRVVAYLAPMLLGPRALACVGGPGPAGLETAVRMQLEEVSLVGGDARVVARFERELRPVG